MGMILYEKTALKTSLSTHRPLPAKPLAFTPGRLPENQKDKLSTRPAAKTISAAMVVASDAENVAAWHGMHMMLLAGSTIAEAPI